MPQFVASQLQICNNALAHLAVGRVITTSILEETEQARACNRFYDQCRDEILRDFNWPFARKYAALIVVAGTDALPPVPASPDWQYAYRMPVDCLRPRRIPSGNRREVEATRVPFWVGQDQNGALIYTDFAPQDATATSVALPQLEYTVTFPNPGDEALFAPDFAQMFSLLLAVYIAPAVTGGDPYKLGQRAMQMYEWARQRAQNNAFGAQQFDFPPESEFVRARA